MHNLLYSTVSRAMLRALFAAPAVAHLYINMSVYVCVCRGNEQWRPYAHITSLKATEYLSSAFATSAHFFSLLTYFCCCWPCCYHNLLYIDCSNSNGIYILLYTFFLRFFARLATESLQARAPS